MLTQGCTSFALGYGEMSLQDIWRIINLELENLRKVNRTFEWDLIHMFQLFLYNVVSGDPNESFVANFVATKGGGPRFPGSKCRQTFSDAL